MVFQHFEFIKGFHFKAFCIGIYAHTCYPGKLLSITVLLGIAGKARSKIHARETGRILSAIDPEYVGVLSLMLIPGTLLYQDYMSGKFSLLESDEMLDELKTMIAATELSKGLFHANHASNYLPIKARLPKDKDATIQGLWLKESGRFPVRES